MEPLTQTSVIPVADATQIALARRTAEELSRAAALDEKKIAAVNLVVSELANNLLQHGGGGYLYLQFVHATGTLDVVAVDHGKGMGNIDRCVVDGFSTGSTPGLGLGAVRRFASDFSAFSVPARTTVVAARMVASKTPPDLGVVCTPIHGEQVSGDAWALSDDGNMLLVIDGLGHGQLAAEAAKAGLSAFRRLQAASPRQVVEAMHAELRCTRGAAAAVARVVRENREIEFAGIGNVCCTLVNANRSQSMVSHNGTLGHLMRRVQQFTYSYQPGDLLVMQSDGLLTHAKLPTPPALLAQPPYVIAPFLFSEQVRGRDDATLLVNRLG